MAGVGVIIQHLNCDFRRFPLRGILMQSLRGLAAGSVGVFHDLHRHEQRSPGQPPARLALLENGQLIADRRRAHMCNPQSPFQFLRKGKGRKILTSRLYHQTDDVAVVDVEHTGIDQIGINDRVKSS